MSKLPVITPKGLLKILRQVGFQVDHTTGSHFILYNPATKRRVVVPYHIKDLPKGTLMGILSEAGIERQDFLKLFERK